MTYALYVISWIIPAYLVGAIPFGYLIALWARGIDIRKHGSGNIGATNVGRTLGFRFFVVVFTLDLLKGFLPTYGIPWLVAAVTGQGAATVGVLVALATILGHNFPIYLRFRGGKGVATSLGALLALDAPAALASAGGFGVSLLITRFVSASSLFGGVVFTAVHFARTHSPFSRDQIAMSLLTIGLMGLLIVRHRKNLARLWEGTEPRVPLRWCKKPPEGRIAWVLLIVGAAASGSAGLAVCASKHAALSLGGCTLTEVARVATGHQRAERLAFADRGRLLAVTCPRYNRVVLYRVTAGETLELHRDVSLDGRPVAIRAVEDRFYVLQRPAGDARHVEPGYWETFDFSGRRIGSKHRVGFYPDDLAITPDGRHALVLTSGNAEGGTNRPRPALAVIALGHDENTHQEVGRVDLDLKGGDPERLALSASGRWATVGSSGTNQPTKVDLSDLSQPAVVEPLYQGATSDPAAWSADAVQIILPELGACIASTQDQRPGLNLYEAAPRRPLGCFPIRGVMNLSPARPTGVAHAIERGLLAVATRSGSVHLIAIRPGPDQLRDRPSKPGIE